MAISVKWFFPLAIFILVLNTAIPMMIANFVHIGEETVKDIQTYISTHNWINIGAIALLLLFRKYSACIPGQIGQ
jgi:hypothetical protein